MEDIHGRLQMDNERDRRPERRKYLRYQYPSDKRPILEIAGWLFPVLDICEHGFRIQTTPSMGFVVGAMVEATIRFSERDNLDLSGTIVRQQGPYAGIFLPGVIPQERIQT